MKTTPSIPFSFALDRIAGLDPHIRPMFGCFAVYIGEKLVMAMRNAKTHIHDNGVWIATAVEHHDSLRKQFPSMRTIGLLGAKTSSWQNIPADAEDFEESVMDACELIVKNDPRIGTVPVRRKKAVRKR